MNKYRNIKTPRIVNGETVLFDSKREAMRYDELYVMARQGKITKLTLQPKYELLATLRVSGHKTMSKRSYIPDFKYIKNGVTIVEDVKGMKTPTYNLKKHMFLLRYSKELVFREIY